MLFILMEKYKKCQMGNSIYLFIFLSRNKQINSNTENCYNFNNPFIY